MSTVEHAGKAPDRIVIVGGGHGGANAAALLRQYGYTGDIVLFCEEALPPYHRPPLSKACLQRDMPIEELALRSTAFYEHEGIELRLGEAVVAIDAAARELVLEGAARLSYRFLILATGSLPRELAVAGAQLQGVHSLRSMADALRLKAGLINSRRVAIIGGGYIGLEVAASVVALGGSVVVLEREARVLQRVASEPLSEYFASYHRSRGVEVVTGADVAELCGDSSGQLCRVVLAEGRSIDVDLAVVGVGSIPRDHLAAAAGLKCANGIVVDRDARTSDTNIFAIGDAACRPMLPYPTQEGDRICRLESVPNTLEMAKQVACAITGRARPKPEVPWFWSDQYQLKLQIAGMAFGVDQCVVRGVAGDAGFSVFQLSQGRLVCVEAVNSPQAFVLGKQNILNRSCPDPKMLGDVETPLQRVLSAGV